MRSRLRRFAIVGFLATGLDVGLLLGIVQRYDGAPIWAANVVALAAASIFAYFGNRFFTFRAGSNARWVRQPALFFATAVFAAVLDTGVLLAANSIVEELWISKILAIATAAVVRWGMYRWILFSVVRRELALRVERPPSQEHYRLSVVVPAYNEEDRIGETVCTLTEALEPTVGPGQLQILVVDDGSSDETVARAEAAGATVLAQPRNRGKGAAVRAGVVAADGRAVVFTDADLAYPPATVLDILYEIEAGWDVVVGSRRHEDTTTLIRARWFRELGGRFVNWLTHIVLLGHFRDTQCGIKGFRGDIGRVIFERCRIDGFAFDVEVFLIAEQDRVSLTEIPVSVENRQGSTVRLVQDTLKLFADLVRMRRAVGWGWYRPNPAQREVLDRRAAVAPRHQHGAIDAAESPQTDPNGSSPAGTAGPRL